ncbi:DNA polymerase I [Beduini massiliensis]|uniref:DNA polymerase I n=1 Tax=Beduini massiliensis TaxID=1585974 RepID=UPI00059A8045|nr:DNA polymerase I [Beduini massiliensis]
MEKIVLIDGNSLLYSAYHATAYTGNFMRTSHGVPMNAVSGFANMIEKLMQSAPDYVFVAFDYGKKTFRNELMGDYKGTRKETDEELICQFPIARDYLKARGIIYQEIEGYEADDIIGTLSVEAKKRGIHVDIVTKDKDMMQLVDENTTVLRNTTGVSEMVEMTPETVFEKYGIRPDQFKDFLGLMGDAADNIPGIKGVGEKTAVKLLTQFESIENMAEHADEIKGKLGEKIRDQIEDAFLSKKIATIKTDVPMEIEFEHYRNTGFDTEVLSAFCREYEMNTLLRKISTVVPDQSETIMKQVTIMPSLTKDFALSVAVYDHNYHKSIVLGYGVYNKDFCGYISYEDALADENFKKVLKDPAIKKYGYDIKKCMIASKWNGIDIAGYDFDLQLSSYILNPSLKDEIKLVMDFHGDHSLPFSEEIFGKGAKRKVPENDVLTQYYGKIAKGIYEIKAHVEEQLREQEQYDLYYNLELPVAYILADMEFTGVKVDRQSLKDMEQDFNETIQQLEKEIHLLAGVEFNIASPKQLGEVLFEKLQLPNGKKTKTGYSTSVDVLEKLAPIHPIIDKVLKYRAITKLYSTYIIGLQEQIFMDGKIHTMYNQALTQTGRLSSTDPNLQNIPIRSEEGRMIRKAFIPSLDYIVSFDYSQIELRVLAHMANVQALIDAFNQDMDIHTKTAQDIFDVSEVDSNMRRQAKAINFGIIYGMSDFGLSEQIGVPVNVAKAFIQKYFETYPGIKEFMDKEIEFCKENGYVATILNRKRYIKEINEKNYMVRELGKRLAMNSPIQGSGADILKLAMIKVDEAMKAKQLKSKMILQVHDELIFDVKKEELDVMMGLIKECMESAVELRVKLKADGAYGKSWYELK